MNDLELGKLQFKKYLNLITPETLKCLNFDESYMYISENEFLSHVGISKYNEETTSKKYVGEYSPENFKRLLNDFGNVATVKLFHHDYSGRALTGPYNFWDIFKSKGLTDLLLSKIPFVKLKNRILRGMGANIYEEPNCIPNIAPNSIFGYDLRAFTFLPGSKLGETGAVFDHNADEESMIRGGVFIGRLVTIGGGTMILPGTIIGEKSIIGLNAVVRGYVPSNCIVMPCVNYYANNSEDLKLMFERGFIKSRTQNGIRVY